MKISIPIQEYAVLYKPILIKKRRSFLKLLNGMDWRDILSYGYDSYNDIYFLKTRLKQMNIKITKDGE